jgi:hypothetical protein
MSGRLSIRLDVGDGRVRPHLARTAGPEAGRWVVGRTARDAAAAIPLVFNLCGAAHRRAAERALGLPVAAAADTARDEAVRDHVLAICGEWPVLFGGAPDADAFAALARHEPAALVHALVGGEAGLATLTPHRLDGWLVCGATATARLLGRARADIDPAWGRAALPALPAAAAVAALEDDGPLPAYETTALDRAAGTPLLAALLADEGPSLFVRMIARLVDLLRWLAPAAEGVDRSSAAAPPGIGLAEAARGLLAHRARLVAGVVADYRVLSPTDWNLGPDGVLARALARLPASPETPRLARLVVSCINPCVPTTIGLVRAGVTADA